MPQPPKQRFNVRSGHSGGHAVPPENILDLRPVKIVADKPPTAAPVKPARVKKQKASRPSVGGSLATFKRSWHRPQVSLSFNFHKPMIRPVVSFVAVCLLIVAPLSVAAMLDTFQTKKATLITSSAAAVRLLEEAMAELQAGNYSTAANSFRTAEAQLDSIQAEIEAAGWAGSVARVTPVVGGRLRSGEALLRAGRHVSRGGVIAAEALADGSSNAVAEEQLSTAIASLGEVLPSILDELSAAVVAIGDVQADDLPVEYADTVRSLQASVPTVTKALAITKPFVDVLTTVLGFDQTQRYLLVFQNNRERRATGGFIGSLALIDIDHGQMRQLEVPGGGPYDLAGQLTRTIVAPQPLHLVNPHWYLHDANWWPDFPTSAEKIMWFYEQSGGPTVDGIFSLTPNLAEELLRIIGSINLEEKYGVTVTADNFVDVAMNEVEFDYDRTANRPKAFIADVVEAVFDKLFTASPDQLLPMLAAFDTVLAEKHLLIYHRDQAIQKAISQYGWAGAMTASGDSDYLMAVHSNISGGKTDGVIETTLQHQATLEADGSIVDTVTVRRFHHGQPGEPLTGVKNNDYLRLYVPSGSQLLSAEGFTLIDQKLFQAPEPKAEIDADLQRIQGQVLIDETTGMRVYDELGYTVFANWLAVAPGDVAEATLTYRLPAALAGQANWSDGSAYRLRVEKQPGDTGTIFSGRVVAPDQAVAFTTDNLTEQAGSTNQRQWQVQGTLERDLAYGLVFSR